MKLNLLVNLDTKTLIVGLNNSQLPSLPPLIQGSVPTLRIRFAAFTYDETTLELLDLQDAAVKVGVTEQPTGIIGSPPLAAFTDVFSYDADARTFTGQLDLRTQDFADMLGSRNVVSVRLQIAVTPLGGVPAKAQADITALADDIDPESIIPIPLSDAFPIVSPYTPSSSLVWQSDGTLKLFINGQEAQHWT